jgi:hypothetical protein
MIDDVFCREQASLCRRMERVDRSIDRLLIFALGVGGHFGGNCAQDMAWQGVVVHKSEPHRMRPEYISDRQRIIASRVPFGADCEIDDKVFYHGSSQLY